MSTAPYNFKPTPAQQKLIEQLVNPENLGKSISEICRLADITRDVYYDAIKKPEFFEYVNKLTYDVIKSKVSDLYNATFRFATQGAKNQSDRKLLFEMLGVYTPKNITEHHTVNYDINALSLEQRVKISEMVKDNVDPLEIDNYYKECIKANESEVIN